MKTKKNYEMFSRNGFLVVTERIKNDRNGNPRYSISVFDKDTLYFSGNWKVVTYNVDHYIEVLLANIKGEWWKE